MRNSFPWNNIEDYSAVLPAMGLPLTLIFVLVVVGTDSSDAGWDWKNSCLDLGGWVTYGSSRYDDVL